MTTPKHSSDHVPTELDLVMLEILMDQVEREVAKHLQKQKDDPDFNIKNDIDSNAH